MTIERLWRDLVTLGIGSTLDTVLEASGQCLEIDHTQAGRSLLSYPAMVPHGALLGLRISPESAALYRLELHSQECDLLSVRAYPLHARWRSLEGNDLLTIPTYLGRKEDGEEHGHVSIVHHL